MKGYSVYSQIQQLKEKGFKKAAVAKQLGINRRTVNRYWDMAVDDYETNIARRVNMAIDIEASLEKQGFAFEVIYNEKMIYTAQEGAEYFQIDLAQIAPTLILYTSKGFYSVILSGSKRLC